MEKRINVAVGLLFNQRGEVLVGQRTVKDQYFQKWEFPGGKIEAQENAVSALERELREELDISVQQLRFLSRVEHDYPDRLVRLHVFYVEDYQGEPRGAENQAIKWVTVQQLSALDFLPGNHQLIGLVETLLLTGKS